HYTVIWQGYYRPDDVFSLFKAAYVYNDGDVFIGHVGEIRHRSLNRDINRIRHQRCRITVRHIEQIDGQVLERLGGGVAFLDLDPDLYLSADGFHNGDPIRQVGGTDPAAHRLRCPGDIYRFCINEQHVVQQIFWPFNQDAGRNNCSLLNRVTISRLTYRYRDH